MAEADDIKRATEEHQLADADAFAAHHMTVVSCEHGTIWIRLHDADGKIKAYGCYDPEGAMNFQEAVMEEVEKVISGTSGSCASVH
jgi:dihydrodipicolinate synthase/N-acetylneuraminate lyase